MTPHEALQTGEPAEHAIRHADDVCSLSLARRLAALLDRDPTALRAGDALPRGWHPMLFNTPTRQSELRHDGAADLGAPLPELGLPRLMLGGRSVAFEGDIPIGAVLRRQTRRLSVQRKQGRSGPFAIVSIEHRIFVAQQRSPVLIEQQDYLLRAAETQTTAAVPAAAAPSHAAATAATRSTPAPADTGAATRAAADGRITRVLVPDESLLFRYSAITDNPHRIHYDRPYAMGAEGYPALVVNGSIPAVFLLEMFRAAAGREPTRFSSRNVAPMYCGMPLALNVQRTPDGWRLWAENAEGRTSFDAIAD